ncbi:putative RDD family membrane protein YckC [Kitasatospora sp. MAA4]|uniref:RDD family protein n=1 Tax=Kitasatospora sp. MAA4 TaxID=3035093 RepID=UPI002472F3DE|nr:RDD family protein [Kitasatospora sp. MAA4]MDH6136692.1 putative RDD family membrane protein YckC [Kitasatospora sp. MAA4]
MSGPPEQALASRGARLGARLVDAVIVLVALIVVMGVSGLLQYVGPQNTVYQIVIAVLCVIGMVAVLLSEPVLTWKYGATLGKRLLGLRVARLDDGQNLSGGRAFGRWAAGLAMSVVPFLSLLNVLWCCWDAPYRQCLHDKSVNSVVVRRTL